MKVEISNGDLLDKISILEIKNHKFDDGPKRENVVKELKSLIDMLLENSAEKWTMGDDYDSLIEVNMALWVIEDSIRMKEAKKEFDAEFIELARSVYLMNDDRAAIKKRINESTQSLLSEEKQYADYDKEKLNEEK